MFSPSGPVELVFLVDLRAAEVCAIVIFMGVVGSDSITWVTMSAVVDAFATIALVMCFHVGTITVTTGVSVCVCVFELCCLVLEWGLDCNGVVHSVSAGGRGDVGCH